ncbi:MAG TPA: hypothetical protein VNS32_17815 [Flavisolibacter sp.]|nr:hypothetical protein [Flavisolibacter sp.]
MQSLIEEILKNGLSEEQAIISIRVIQDFLNDHYPILAALASTTIFKEALENRSASE